MARKRRRRGGSNAAPFIVFGLLLVAVAAYAIWPRGIAHHRRAPRAASTVAPVAEATPAPTLRPRPARTSPPPSPVASAAASPLPAIRPSPAGGARLALIIDDCGQWLDTERAFVALPIPLTLAVLPHVRYSQTIAGEAHAAGKGVMLHLPMEPVSRIYPGPGEITTLMQDDAIAAQAANDIDQVPYADGVNNHEGSLATADPRVMEAVMQVLKQHGLFFVDSRTTAKTVAAQIAEKDGVANASRNVFLDDRPTLSATEAMLEEAAADARRDGSAIAIGHPKPTTLAAVRDLYPKLEAEGVRFVLVQSLVKV